MAWCIDIQHNDNPVTQHGLASYVTKFESQSFRLGSKFGVAFAQQGRRSDPNQQQWQTQQALKEDFSPSRLVATCLVPNDLQPSVAMAHASTV